VNTYVKPDVRLPISLHDAILTGMTVRRTDGRGELELEFAEGVFRVETGEAVRTGKAALLFTGVDFDFCRVSVCTKNARREAEWEAFAEELKKTPVEVTDEAYGYHSTFFRGYLYRRGNWREVEMEICHFAETQYRWEDG